MTGKSAGNGPRVPGGARRRERLEAQLRANLQRRKAQARARSETEEGGGPPDAATEEALKDEKT